MQLSAGAGT